VTERLKAADRLTWAAGGDPGQVWDPVRPRVGRRLIQPYDQRQYYLAAPPV
jgi:hypothetical protein